MPNTPTPAQVRELLAKVETYGPIHFRSGYGGPTSIAVNAPGLLESWLRMEAALREVNTRLCRELAEPRGGEQAAMVECCTIIDAALAGEAQEVTRG